MQIQEQGKTLKVNNLESMFYKYTQSKDIY